VGKTSLLSWFARIIKSIQPSLDEEFVVTTIKFWTTKYSWMDSSTKRWLLGGFPKKNSQVFSKEFERVLGPYPMRRFSKVFVKDFSLP
jgi:hypothetical protein